MPLQFIRDDITRVRADAIVNTANPEPTWGGGTDAAVYLKAGQEAMLQARREIGPLEPGQVAVTPGFNLPADFVLHTVGPVWQGGSMGEAAILRQCYRGSLEKAIELGCDSIAFPLIATGVYGYPREQALPIAISEISDFLLTHEMNVLLVLFDRETFHLTRQIFRDVDELIDEREVRLCAAREYEEASNALSGWRRRWQAQKKRTNAPVPLESAYDEDATVETAPEPPMASSPIMASYAATSWEEFTPTPSETFQQKLLALIDEKQMTDVEVYKRANLDRKLFSKIRCNTAYKPTKRTALALAVAMRLTLDETRDLLSRAELALSPSNKADIIITFFIERGNYDIYDINLALFKHDQQLLGA